MRSNLLRSGVLLGVLSGCVGDELVPQLESVELDEATVDSIRRVVEVIDADEDGFTDDVDCDDRDAEVGDTITYFIDKDRDHYGSEDDSIAIGCNRPRGYVSVSGDCDDEDPSINPYASDLPSRQDGIDNNCNGLIDEAVTSTPAELAGISVGIRSNYVDSVALPVDSEGCIWNKSSRGRNYHVAEIYDGNGSFDPTVEVVERCYPSAGFTWEDLLVHAVSSMSSYGYNAPAVAVAYGVLQGGNPGFDRNSEWHETFRDVVLPQIYKSKELRRAMYLWSMPTVQAHFATMSPEDQQLYLDIFSHAEVYLDSVTDDFAAETAYYEELAAADCSGDSSQDRWYGSDCTRYFTRYSSSDKWKEAKALYSEERAINARGHVSEEDSVRLIAIYDEFDQMTSEPFRKLEAWMYRRATSGELSRSTMRAWVPVIESDLREVASE